MLVSVPADKKYVQRWSEFSSEAQINSRIMLICTDITTCHGPPLDTTPMIWLSEFINGPPEFPKKAWALDWTKIVLLSLPGVAATPTLVA